MGLAGAEGICILYKMHLHSLDGTHCQPKLIMQLAAVPASSSFLLGRIFEQVIQLDIGRDMGITTGCHAHTRARVCDAGACMRAVPAHFDFQHSNLQHSKLCSARLSCSTTPLCFSFVCHIAPRATLQESPWQIPSCCQGAF